MPGTIHRTLAGLLGPVLPQAKKVPSGPGKY